MFKKYQNWIDTNQNLLTEISDQIWKFAELGFQEIKSSKLLIATLKESNFEVVESVADMPTAFYASFGDSKPIIAILGEYDALPGLSQEAEPIQKPIEKGGPGHGCGHNLLGTGSLGAALAVKEAIEQGDVKGTIRYYGCPAEELFNSKGYMIKEGLFDDVDISLTWHPSFFNMLNLMSTLAMNSVIFKFHGITAHAAADPQNGRSALDAVELMDVAANYMREHMISEARLHYVITNGGNTPNVVPAEAAVHYFVRAPERHQVENIYKRLINIAKGAALMTETEMEIEFLSGTYNTMYNSVVDNVIASMMKKVGPTKFDRDDMRFAIKLRESIPKNSMEGLFRLIPPDMLELAKVVLNQPLNKMIIPPIGKGKVAPGSSDVADVTWKLPLGEFTTACHVVGSPGHSWQNVATAGMSIGHKGMLTAAKILTLSALEFMSNLELIEQAWKEHEKKHEEKIYKSPFPEGLKPPIHRTKKISI
jgi:aminobenzoyl-glutamate utilization protein B